jgi:pyruvate dehydrogenase E1 component
MYRLRESVHAGPRVQLLGSGSILREVLKAAEVLEADFGVAADVWSVTSFTELRRDGIECDRWNLLYPGAPPRKPFVTAQLEAQRGPVVATTDFIRAYPDQIRAWVPRRYAVLGTDGFGRSDTRTALREFFGVDARFITVAALSGLAKEGVLAANVVEAAVEKYGLGSRPSEV